MNQEDIPLRKIRKDLALSQEVIACALGIKTTTYSKIERGVIQLTVSRLYELARVFNLSPEAMLSYDKPSSEAASSLTVAPSLSGNITYIPVHAQAGFLDQHADQRAVEGAFTFSVPTFTDNNLFMISVEGDSMYPTIAPGAFVIIKGVEDKHFVRWGEPHVVVTTDGRVIKRVLRHRDAALVTLYSDNNELYQPYDIPKDSILSLWQLVGMLSKSFMPKNIYQGISSASEVNANTLP